MKRLIITAAWAALMTAPFATAAQQVAPETPATAMIKEVEKVEDTAPRVDFVTGGIGKAERENFARIESNYNVKIEMATDKGFYIADANVTIHDKSGTLLLDAVADGPYFLVNLEPGTYTIAATHEGEEKSQKATIGSKGQKRVLFMWKDDEAY